MPEYKIQYFNVKALAEPLRFLLSYKNIPFDDVRIQKEDWPEIKKTMPMGQMPIMEVDGKRAHQSLAMARYLAKQVGLNGANDWEDLEIDMAVDTINDFRNKIGAVQYEADEEVQKKKRVTLDSEIIPFYLEKLEAMAAANDGHFALSKLTWADLYFVGILDYLNFMAKKDLTENHPNLTKVKETVLALEGIKNWVAKRPETEL
ncbi:glutathione S-transferase-like [Chironomus tepperi]|uniref:glutathione S-transferase-like n=1 Tax=Chironomus tepperi TaxID=113505 RepID=UPI00391F2768